MENERLVSTLHLTCGVSPTFSIKDFSSSRSFIDHLSLAFDAFAQHVLPIDTLNVGNKTTLTYVNGPSGVTYSAPWGDLVADGGSNVSLTFQDTTGGNQYINMSVLASSPVGSLESDGRLRVAV